LDLSEPAKLVELSKGFIGNDEFGMQVRDYISGKTMQVNGMEQLQKTN